MKLMKSLGVEGRSGRCVLCRHVCVRMCCLCARGVEVTLETYDKEGIDQGESNDDKCHRSALEINSLKQ